MAKNSAIKRLVKTRALRQGLIGGSPLWRAIWVSQFLYKQYSKLSKGGDPPISFDEPLKEGEVWAVVHEPEKTKKGRGEGRKLVVGPRRAKPRVNTMTGLALGVMGEKILAAPSAERINQILGEDVFEPPKPTRAQKRASKKAAKSQAKHEAQIAKHDRKRAKIAAKEAAKATKLAQKQAEAAAKKAAKRPKSESVVETIVVETASDLLDE